MCLAASVFNQTMVGCRFSSALKQICVNVCVCVGDFLQSLAVQHLVVNDLQGLQHSAQPSPASNIGDCADGASLTSVSQYGQAHCKPEQAAQSSIAAQEGKSCMSMSRC